MQADRFSDSPCRDAPSVSLPLFCSNDVTGSRNVQGEEVKKLDALANEIFISALRTCGNVSALVSEEEDELVTMQAAEGKYAVVFDPLDGSSNINYGISIGTIFGIYDVGIDDSGVLRPGRELAAAGYALYGSSTILVLCNGASVHGYTLDPIVGEFLLTHADVLSNHLMA